MLDAIVEELGRPDRYPNLREVTIAGHSAGGQFVQRYAAGTRIEQQPAIAALGLRFRYVVANPSSYMYLFPREPDALTGRCPRFDEYKFGLTDVNTCYKVLPTDLYRRLELRSERFELCAETTAKLLRGGYRIREVPISYRPRTRADGKKIGVKDGLWALWCILRY